MKYARRESNIENKVWEVCKITFAKKANRDRHCFFLFFVCIMEAKLALTREHKLNHAKHSVKNNKSFQK